MWRIDYPRREIRLCCIVNLVCNWYLEVMTVGPRFCQSEALASPALSSIVLFSLQTTHPQGCKRRVQHKPCRPATTMVVYFASVATLVRKIESLVSRFWVQNRFSTVLHTHICNRQTIGILSLFFKCSLPSCGSCHLFLGSCPHCFPPPPLLLGLPHWFHYTRRANDIGPGFLHLYIRVAVVSWT